MQFEPLLVVIHLHFRVKQQQGIVIFYSISFLIEISWIVLHAIHLDRLFLSIGSLVLAVNLNFILSDGFSLIWMFERMQAAEHNILRQEAPGPKLFH